MWWKCKKCGERVENSLEVCWNCGTNSEGVEDPNFRKVDDETKPLSDGWGHDTPLTCLRCNQRMRFMGTKAFHEGTRWGRLGDWGEHLVNKLELEMFFCTQCGRVEFYVEGVGDDQRHGDRGKG